MEIIREIVLAPYFDITSISSKSLKFMGSISPFILLPCSPLFFSSVIDRHHEISYNQSKRVYYYVNTILYQRILELHDISFKSGRIRTGTKCLSLLRRITKRTGYLYSLLWPLFIFCSGRQSMPMHFYLLSTRVHMGKRNSY